MRPGPNLSNYKLPTEEELFAQTRSTLLGDLLGLLPHTLVDFLGWLLVAVALFATYCMISMAHAAPLEDGYPLPQCMPIELKADALKFAESKGKVQTFDASTSAKLAAAVNNTPPPTDWEATTVDTVTVSDGPVPVRVFFTDAKKFCLIAVFKEAKWKELEDQAFTAPVPAPRGTGI